MGGRQRWGAAPSPCSGSVDHYRAVDLSYSNIICTTSLSFGCNIIQSNSTTMSFRDVRVRNSNEETMSSSIKPRVLASMCEAKLDNQFELSFRDTRDRNLQPETTSLPTHWNKTKKPNRDASRVVSKTFAEDMSYPCVC